MRHIAIIPARGGSKRLPNKNIIDFKGKPMIAWTIEVALQSGLFHRVLVSTDSSEIADIAKQYGASVPFLRSQAADDYSPVSYATYYALQQCVQELGEEYDIVTQLMANTPLRTAKDIQDSMENFLNRSAVAQLSCFPFGWMNPWWAFKLKDDGQPDYLFDESLTERSQDLPTLYCPTGAVWIAKSKTLLKNRSFYCPGHIFYPLAWQSAVDIDDEDDLAMAEAVFDRISRHTCKS